MPTEETVSLNETTQDQGEVTPEPGQETAVTDSETPSNEGTAPEQEQEIEFEGTKYKATQIKEALEAAKNREKWQKELTQRSQALSEEQKKYRNFESESQRLERAAKIHDRLQEHPELLRRFKDAERQYFEDLENDPEIKQKVEFTKLQNEMEALKANLHQKDVEMQKMNLSNDLLKLKESEGLTDEEATAVIQETIEKGWPSLEGAYYALFKDRITQRIRQQAEKDALEKKRLGVEVKKGKTTNASPAPKNDGRIPDYEDWMQHNRGKSLQDYLNVYAKT